MAIAFFYAHKFTVVGMGEDFATNLGLDYNKIVNLGLIIVSIVTLLPIKSRFFSSNSSKSDFSINNFIN